VLTLLPKRFETDLTEHLQAEVLFYDRICLAVSARSAWARKRKIDIRDLVGAEMISPASDTPGGAAVIDAFRAARLPPPHIRVTTFSVHLRSILTMRGDFIAVLPASILRFNPDLYSLKELPVELRMPQPPAFVVKLKDRTVSPRVDLFIESTREVAKAMDLTPKLDKQPSARKRVPVV
jgi:DNA-binding transcriptional LysR family regulator